MKKFTFAFFLFVLSLSTVFGQTLTHPEKVYINPPGTGGTDSLKIDGGLRAGSAGSVQVINADGTISVSATIGDGTIQKIKLGTDCSNGQILVRNSAGTPPYWDCGTASSAGGIQASDNNVTITGTGWRFQNSTVFGSSVTAQELVHIYNSAGIAGIALQNNAQDWRIRATNNDLQVSNGSNYPLTIKTNQIGIFDTVPEAGWEVDLTGDFRVTGNIGNLGAFTNHVYPNVTDTLDLGIYNTKWRSLYVGSVVMDQFVTQNVLLYDGYHIIGKSSGELNAAISGGDTSFVADESHSVGDYLVIRGRDSGGGLSTEYMVITNKSGVGPYTYSVTRNLDGSGANSWAIDTPYLILGKQYDGRIEMFTNAGIPTIRVIVQGSAWNTFDSLVHMGGLDGITGVDAARYGLYVGKQDGTGNYLKFQNSLGSPTGDDGKLLIKGGIVAGSYVVSNSTVEVNAQGLTVGNTGSVRGGKDTYGDALAGFWMGYDSTAYKFYIGNNTNYVRWTGTQLDVRGTLNASDINAGTMAVAYLQTDALTAAYIAAGAIGTSELAADAVTSNEISSSSGIYVGPFKVLRTWGGQLIYCASCGPGGSAGGQFYVGDGGIDVTDYYIYWDGQKLSFRTPNTVLSDAGNLTATSATLSGSITSTSGSIGGWTLGTTSLTSGTGATTVGIDSGGSNPAFYAGSATPASAPFRVTNAGALTSTSGSIGGWTLGATSLTSGSGGTTVGVDSGGSNPAFYAGSATPGSAPFRVTNAGVLTAIGATLQSATSGARVVFDTTPAVTWYDSGGQLGQLNSGGIVLGPSSGEYAAYDDKYAFRFSVGSSNDGPIFGLYANYTADALKTLALRNTWDGASTSDSGNAVTIIEAVSKVYPGPTTYTSTIQLNTAVGGHSIAYTSGTHAFTGTVTTDASSGTGLKVTQNGTSSSDIGMHLFVPSGNPWAAVIEQEDTITTGNQYPIDLRHSITSGSTAGAGMGVGISFSKENNSGTMGNVGYLRVNAAGADNTDSYFTMAVRVGSTNTSLFSFGGSNMTSTPGWPWMRSDGGYLVVNADNDDLFLNWDTGSTGEDIFMGSSADQKVYVGGTTGYWKWNSGATEHEFSHNIITPGLYITNWQNPGAASYTVCTTANGGGGDGYLLSYNGLCSGSSSLRYKTNIQPATFQWAKILEIPIVTFEYKNDLGVSQFGAIAETVDALGLRELVIYDAEGRPDGLRYEKMGLYLIPIVRAQQSEIAQLKARLSALEAKK